MYFFGDSPFTKSEVFHSPPYNRVLPSSSSLRRESTKDVVASESTSELSSVDCVFSLMGSAFSHTGLSIMAKTSDMREGPRSRVKEFMESEGLMEYEHGMDGIAVSVSEPLWISGGQAEGELPWAGRSVRDSLGKVTKPDSKPAKQIKNKIVIACEFDQQRAVRNSTLHLALPGLQHKQQSISAIWLHALKGIVHPPQKKVYHHFLTFMSVFLSI